ncbi:MAG: hypothetical protein JWR67_2104 [Mucilaginibacter sp.]|nr:hypothetical protein [Mucilaginibacter sp.]
MKKLLFLIALSILFSSFYQERTLKGTWEYKGGIYNGKPDSATRNYTLQRKYTNTQYNAYLIEKGEKTQKYEGGNYSLKGDTCLETQTYSAEPSKLIGVTIHYLYTIRHDTLILKAQLPNGIVEEDYWKKVK